MRVKIDPQKLSASHRKHRKHEIGYWGKWRGKTCEVVDCDKPAVCKGFCNVHYGRAYWASGRRPPSANAEAYRRAHYKCTYGITVEEYDTLLAKQNGVCAICCEPPNATNCPKTWKGRLCIDHDHETTAVRGLLCNNCNQVIGFAKEQRAVLLSAIEYVTRHG